VVDIGVIGIVVLVGLVLWGQEEIGVVLKAVGLVLRE
jgi:hypothetical protein